MEEYNIANLEILVKEGIENKRINKSIIKEREDKRRKLEKSRPKNKERIKKRCTDNK